MRGLSTSRGDSLTNFENLTDDQKARAVAAKTPEEILELVREGGYELTEEELDSIIGGWSPSPCNPKNAGGAA